MKILPAFKNANVCDFIINMTQDCVKHYQLDVARDVAYLYKMIFKGYQEILWGVRENGTQMGFHGNLSIEYYKENKNVVLFIFENLRVIDGDIYGDIRMVSYTEGYDNEWYNETGEITHWYHADDCYDRFYDKVSKITGRFFSKLYSEDDNMNYMQPYERILG